MKIKTDMQTLFPWQMRICEGWFVRIIKIKNII